MRLNLKLHFSFEVTDNDGQILRQDHVKRDLNFENTEPVDNFVGRLESFFQELLFAYVPGYPFHKKFKVNRLEAKSGDLLLVEYQAGLCPPEEKARIEKHEITHNQLAELQKTLAALMKEIDDLKSRK